MKKSQIPVVWISWILAAAFLMSACSQFPRENGSSATPEKILPVELAQADLADEAPAGATALPEEPAILPASLEKLDANNLDRLGLAARLDAYIPANIMFSEDGRLIAAGGLQGVDVSDARSGEQLSHFPLELPQCAFGAGSPMRFDPRGEFLAVVTLNAIEVWQVGGGRIFTREYSRQFSTVPQTCGADLPQVALSPGAQYLAISAVEYSHQSARKAFAILDVFRNEVVYTWDGKSDGPHGNLVGYGGLGFSQDGAFLQTFDPSLFFAFSGRAHNAFQFWSAPDWQPVDPISSRIASVFSAGSLVFPLEHAGVLSILRRTDGQSLGSLEGASCSVEFPCEVRFSPDGQKTALLSFTSGTVPFRAGLLSTDLSIWDLQSGEKTQQISLLAPDMNGVWLSDAGKVLVNSAYSQEALPVETWWTTATHFAGLRSLTEGQLAFVPFRTALAPEPACSWCGTCTLDLAAMRVECGNRLLDDRGQDFEVETREGNLLLRYPATPSTQTVSEWVIPVALPPGWDARVVGFSADHQVLFYCLDENERPQGCQIASFERGDFIASPEDISALRFSPSGSQAAFVNREENALYMVDLAVGKMTRARAFQSRAWPVNPLFYNQNDELVYLIQNLQSPSLISLEWLDAPSGKVLRRAALEDILQDRPTVAALSAADSMLALGDQGGRIYLLDAVEGKLLHTFQAHTDALIGLSFAQGDKVLVSMGLNGQIKTWAVAE